MAASFESLQALVDTGKIRVGIIGLGYVGLPLAQAFVQAGLRVLGFDVDPDKVGKLQKGEGYIAHVPSPVIKSMCDAGFEATTDAQRLAEVDAILICVPTPLTATRDPDLTFVIGSAGAIAASLRPGQLIVLESTTYPGTTRDVVLPILEARGLVGGRDFFLAFSPEREDPSNAQFTLANVPKVVAGLDPASRALAAALFARVAAQVVPVSSLEVAEACKILENTYRAVNIAMVNEMKVLFDHMGVDIREVIAAAKTKPFGFQAFYPGPGVGGHCIPIDPFYLTWIARKFGLTTRFIELAGEVNSNMPAYVVGKVQSALNDRGKPLKDSRITLLGIAYKKDVDDARESPALEILALLREKAALVQYNDPHIPRLPPFRRFPDLKMTSQALTPQYLQSQDCILVVTDHSAYDWDLIVKHSPLVVDTRNATQLVREHRDRIIHA